MDINVIKTHVLTATTITHSMGKNKTSYSLEKYFSELQKNNKIFGAIFVKYENESIGRNIRYGKLTTIGFDDIYEILKNYSLFEIHQYLYLLVPFGLAGSRISIVMNQIEKYMEKTPLQNNLSLNQIEGQICHKSFTESILESKSEMENKELNDNSNMDKITNENKQLKYDLSQFSDEINRLNDIVKKDKQVFEALTNEFTTSSIEMNSAFMDEKCKVENCNNIIRLERNNMTKVLNENIILNDIVKGNLLTIEKLNNKIKEHENIVTSFNNNLLEKDKRIYNYEDTFAQLNDKIKEHENVITSFNNNLLEKDKTILNYEDTLTSFNDNLLEKDKRIINYEDTIIQMDAEIGELQTMYNEDINALESKLKLANGTLDSYKEALILINNKLLETNENNKAILTKLNNDIIKQKADLLILNEKLTQTTTDADIHKNLYFQYKQEVEKIKGIINK